MPRLFLLLLLAAAPPAVEAADLRGVFPQGGIIFSGFSMEAFDTYDADTLWERINGEAEIHRSYGLLRAAYARYGDGSGGERSLQIALFEMPDSLSSFGLYSSYRPGAVAEAGLGNGAVIDGFQAFLWHGPYFAAFEFFGPEDFTRQALAKGVSAVAEALGDAPPPPRPVEVLSLHVEKGSMIYRPDHLLGRKALPPGIEGRTASGQVIFMATAEVDAGETIAAYGKSIEGVSVSSAGDGTVLRGRDPDRGPVTLLFRGNLLAGTLHGEETPPSGRKLEEMLISLGATP